jgi:hypothetical protein
LGGRAVKLVPLPNPEAHQPSEGAEWGPVKFTVAARGNALACTPRLGADKDGDYVWVGNSFGGTLGRIDIRTKEIKLVPLPNPEAHQPYQVQVDSKHNVWTNLWSTDKVARYDPGKGQWTLFDLPNRGTEARYIAIAERDGKLEVILPYYRTRKVAVMTFRSEAELTALRAQAER